MDWNFIFAGSPCIGEVQPDGKILITDNSQYGRWLQERSRAANAANLAQANVYHGDYDGNQLVSVEQKGNKT